MNQGTQSRESRYERGLTVRFSVLRNLKRVCAIMANLLSTLAAVDLSYLTCSKLPLLNKYNKAGYHVEHHKHHFERRRSALSYC